MQVKIPALVLIKVADGKMSFPPSRIKKVVDIRENPYLRADNLARDEQLKERWEHLVASLSNQFADGDTLDLDAIIYLVGVQELGQLHKTFKKDEKVNLMHIAICRLLEPFGYYEFDYFDTEGWPHYKILEQLPPLKAGEQSILMKEALVLYFMEKEYIH